MEILNNFNVWEKSTYITSIQQWWVCDCNEPIHPYVKPLTLHPDCGIAGNGDAAFGREKDYFLIWRSEWDLICMIVWFNGEILGEKRFKTVGKELWMGNE